jgi:hypothetical protein
MKYKARFPIPNSQFPLPVSVLIPQYKNYLFNISAFIYVFLLKQYPLYFLIFAGFFFRTGNVFSGNYKSKTLPNL